MANRKEKGKATSSGKRKQISQSANTSDAAFYARRISGSDRKAQNIPPTDKHKFSNAFSEQKFEKFQKRNLHVEQELHIPDELSRYTDDRIAQWGWRFLVYLRCQQILVIEEAIEHALNLEPRPSGKDAYEEA
ncbi:hypothetical protein AHAS_Ahas10G0133300 [Arachis hypogaea]